MLQRCLCYKNVDAPLQVRNGPRTIGVRSCGNFLGWLVPALKRQKGSGAGKRRRDKCCIGMGLYDVLYLRDLFLTQS